MIATMLSRSVTEGKRDAGQRPATGAYAGSFPDSEQSPKSGLRPRVRKLAAAATRLLKKRKL